MCAVLEWKLLQLLLGRPYKWARMPGLNPEDTLLFNSANIWADPVRIDFLKLDNKFSII